MEKRRTIHKTNRRKTEKAQQINTSKYLIQECIEIIYNETPSITIQEFIAIMQNNYKSENPIKKRNSNRKIKEIIQELTQHITHTKEENKRKTFSQEYRKMTFQNTMEIKTIHKKINTNEKNVITRKIEKTQESNTLEYIIQECIEIIYNETPNLEIQELTKILQEKYEHWNPTTKHNARNQIKRKIYKVSKHLIDKTYRTKIKPPYKEIMP